MQKFRPSLSSLSCHICRHRLRARGHATSSRAAPNPYPYPTIKNPTPHQIFHLPHSATENDIKARYFDLVRIYHPDKATSSVHPDIAHERFQAITTAYDILRGKKGPSLSGPSNPHDLSYQTTAAYRAARRRRQELYSSGAVDDRWKDRIFIGLVLATVGVFLLQSHSTRKEAMSDMILSRRSIYPSPERKPAEANRKPTKEEERLSA